MVAYDIWKANYQMDYTKSRGNVVELQCLSKFIELGYDCSIPYGDASKYDFVVDYYGEFLRIQCKSSIHPKRKDGTVDTGAIYFSCCTQTTNTVKTIRHKYTSDTIDYFATFFNGQVYIIPVDECSDSKTLRLTPPMNGQKNYNKAEDYKIENYFQPIFDTYGNNSNQIYYCKECGKIQVGKEDGLCVKCMHKKQQIVIRPSREELKKMIRTMSFLEIGRTYNVSDNAIRKWCDAEKLPRKKTEIKKYSDEEWILI